MVACTLGRRARMDFWRTDCLNLGRVSLELEGVSCEGSILQSMAKSQIARNRQY